MKRTRHMNQHMLAPVELWKFAFSPQGLSAKGLAPTKQKSPFQHVVLHPILAVWLHNCSFCFENLNLMCAPLNSLSELCCAQQSVGSLIPAGWSSSGFSRCRRYSHGSGAPHARLTDQYRGNLVTSLTKLATVPLEDQFGSRAC
jgi:hypothetical protein